ncbi:amidohydrolase family protein [Marinicella sediminis]|uniref:Amidohydrolase family protein n=1 Tax=Marinicella sediminis TaxID=1792834 RepID=A0ABV7JAC9_9GAMM|nr:amidohydrolase family protein [Marinicella sediminis]
MNTKLKLTAWAVLACSQFAQAAQVPTETVNGNIDQRTPLMALTHATIHVNPDKTLEQATVLIQGDRIVGISEDNQVPDDAQVINYRGLHIYPGFIHLDASTGLPEPDKKPPFSWGGKETINSTKPGAYNNNEAIKASYDAAEHFNTDAKANQKLREAGFTVALSHRKDGIMRGTSVLTHLSDGAPELSIIKSQVAQHYSFDKGSSKQDYPISLMGAAALIRQTWLDADWYARQDVMVDLDLAAINQQQQLPKFITVGNWQQNLLADKIATEFATQFMVRTQGDSYQNLTAVKATGQALIVPLKFPKAPEIHDQLDAWNIDYTDLKKWELAPHNPALLEQQEITFALVPDEGPKALGGFLKDLRTAHEKGLSQRAALAALTETPAQLLGAKDLGAVAEGYLANLVITDGPLLSKGTQIAETWVAGQNHTINGRPDLLSGMYELAMKDHSHQFELKREKGKYKLSPVAEDDPYSYQLTTAGQFAKLTVKSDEKEVKLLGLIKDHAINATDGSGWVISKTSDLDADKQTDPTKDQPTQPVIPSPFTAYGMASIDPSDSVLIQNATVWTNEEQGILQNTDVLVIDGKINKLGQNLQAAHDIKVIDGSELHLTTGIIDEHAHIALLSVNDIAVNSSMVRMEDVVNPHDINIYRNLSGGVTAAQLLHGSANPIGGQSALIKLKWGASHPEDLLIDDAKGFIKFALGENVKRSRSQDSIRYPLTRMGVEQVYRDAFTQARAYEQEWQAFNNLSSRAQKRTTPPRKDLAMEATLEVLNQQRFVSCHSYVQSEINMLMHVAEDFDFRVNTFTHILEGYKVADKMKAHGVGGSTFADWWAYKWEVNYAIPYNAALMNNEGVVTAINSDSAEMSRRLNQEAAKAIKYGGLSETEAWKLVTLNPAKLLHLDDRMGSIAVGKDADLVLWSDHPLSIYAKAEKTLVDGVLYFDREQQADLESMIATEKQRLIDLSKASPGQKAPFKSMPPKTYECESITGYHEFDHMFYTGAQQ